MEKIKYTEYNEIIRGEEGDIEMTVQVPEDREMGPVRIIEKQGNKIRIRTLDEWSLINQFIAQALAEAGYEKT